MVQEAVEARAEEEDEAEARVEEDEARVVAAAVAEEQVPAQEPAAG